MLPRLVPGWNKKNFLGILSTIRCRLFNTWISNCGLFCIFLEISWGPFLNTHIHTMISAFTFRQLDTFILFIYTWSTDLLDAPIIAHFHFDTSKHILATCIYYFTGSYGCSEHSYILLYSEVRWKVCNTLINMKFYIPHTYVYLPILLPAVDT